MNYQIYINKGIIAIKTHYTTHYFDNFEEAEAFVKRLSH